MLTNLWQNILTSCVIRVRASEPAGRDSLVSGPVKLGVKKLIPPVAVVILKVAVAGTVGGIFVAVIETVWNGVTCGFEGDALPTLADKLFTGTNRVL